VLLPGSVGCPLYETGEGSHLHDGACPTLSWYVRLAVRLGILLLLISLMNFLEDGVTMSGARNLFILPSTLPLPCHCAYV
jgi:hypothetical protein